MSTFYEWTWPITDIAAVCQLQDTTGAGALILNGNLFNNTAPNQLSFVANTIPNGFIRSVSVTSANNLSAVSFIVTGFQNSAAVIDTIVGPHNNTVYGVKAFDEIVSITVTGEISQASVGTGSIGYLPLIAVNTLTNPINFSVQVSVPSGSGITYSLFRTLSSIPTDYLTFISLESTDFFAISSNQTISQILDFTNVSNHILFKIVSSTTPTTDIINFKFLQV